MEVYYEKITGTVIVDIHDYDYDYVYRPWRISSSEDIQEQSGKHSPSKDKIGKKAARQKVADFSPKGTRVLRRDHT